jgi:predicted metalloendopeptidase
LEHFNTANVDTKADPCDDFYKYADGKWLAAHPIPADQAVWGVASPLQLWNETVLLQTLEANSPANPKRTPNEQKIGDYYYACMDTNAIDAHTAQWLKPELDRIAAIKDKAGFAEEIA